ncbi:MAG: acetoin utilization deacetylase AcuC-like enzyme [Bradymonadia bacterium]|jgi:acetoin utilization deacetylase AcuC-like enzyme
MEGGYDLDALSESIVACLRVLDGDRPLDFDAKAGRAHESIERVKAIHGLA